MNKRIEELWSQTVRNYGHSGQEICAQQFAELIVRECADFVSETATIETLLGDRLKEHFGVE